MGSRKAQGDSQRDVQRDARGDVRGDGADVCAVAPPFDVFDENCPSRTALLDVTGRWGALTLLALARGARRFGEVHRSIGGSSERMLAQTLRALESDGLLTHTPAGEGRPGGYELTAPGTLVAARVGSLVDALYDALGMTGASGVTGASDTTGTTGTTGRSGATVAD